MSIATRSLILVALLFAVVGCGPGSTPVPVETTPPSELIKKDLQYLIETGMVGSEMMSIQKNIDLIKESDPEKGAELQQDYDKLDKASSGQARGIAKKMAEKL
ncbi:hypothetical protein AB1L30_15180 [Bremerella sp. JC817]|uniref:hypothetical protein n=1 Tax=Bremerella sp. JC817 TaxID=3231756 RepID=UPI003459301F